ncbi:hypothetical protein K450DRAFT_236411 [Umbelopsis ramanniana AG]|uniref:Major facilitator superfamily (MFS) profile domain-containing protein n=1 Tax=Umbelopsis ramanniana AG TaxID=1314678 RepID=A0AAD5HFE2_UMBRA|nr:uncharacterized protein K450DRAFT_236411 [Umbelopsis ramanniana AG]KAI8580606.1 hypothetical protein K450DRAFT_236411 [Umbelopsis ramanniana AG]
MPNDATNKGMIQLYFLCAVAITNSAVNGYDGSMMNGLTAGPNWNGYFGHPLDNPSLLGLINAIMSVGSFIGVWVAPYLSDNYGRKKAIIVGSVINLVGVALQSAAVHVGMFIAARFILGFGIAITGNAAPTLVVEIAHPKYRGTITGLYNTTWYVGSIIAAWVTFGTVNIDSTWSWRIPSMLQALPSLLQVSAIFFMTESPRWLIGRGRDEEAKDILIRLHGNGDPNDEVVRVEFAEIKEAIAMEQAVSKREWKELIETPGNRMRTFICICVGLFSQWSGNGITSYYLTPMMINIGITDPYKITLINGIKNIVDWIFAVGGTLMLDRVGRRPMFMISMAGMILGYVLVTGMSAAYNNDPTGPSANAYGQASVGFIFIYSAFYDIAWTPMTVLYPVEILPFTIRAKGMAIQGAAVAIALFFNQYVNPVALAAIGWKYYIVYDIWLVVEFFIVWRFFKETRNKTLEALAEVFDGPNAALVVAEQHKLEELASFDNLEKV